MTLNKKKTVREIGRRTRIRNRDVQAVIEALIEVWTDELVAGGRIEIENFIVIEVQRSDSKDHESTVGSDPAPRVIQQLQLRTGKTLKQQLQMPCQLNKCSL